jgi:hypothetical protein
VVLAPFLIVGYMIAFPYDQKRGRTRLFNDLMTLWAVPLSIWTAHGTAVCVRLTLGRPLWPRTSALGMHVFYGPVPSLLRPAMEMFLFGVAYLVVLFDHREYITRT